MLFSVLISFPSTPLNAIELKLTERSGIARTEEPVTFGLPLPQGYAASLDSLMLTIDGKPAPVEFRAVDNWPDGSLRWVHADFQASLAAGGSIKLNLEQGESPETNSKLQVEQDSGTITVSTGKIRVEVVSSGFNLFNRVWLNSSADNNYSNQIVAPHRGGLTLLESGERYLSSNGKSAELSVESRGPMRVVLRAEGRLVISSEKSPFHYVCRMYFYNDSPLVRLAYTVENRDPAVENKKMLEGLQIQLPTTLGAKGLRYVIGSENGDISGNLDEAGSEVWSMAASSEKYSFAGLADSNSSGNPKAEKSDRLGWIGISGSGGAVAMGLRYFWQMHPGSLEAAADGAMLTAGLLPERFDGTTSFYSGMARTHYLHFAFLDNPDPELMRSYAASVQKPLMPVASPAYYCRQSMAFGKLTERNRELYTPDNLETVKRVESELDLGLDNMLGKLDYVTKNEVSRDAYGFLHWGDGLHHAWQSGNPTEQNLVWNGHYYDLPYMTLLEFFRTGDWRYLDYSLSRSHHQMDIHQVHFGPRSSYRGWNRYCPATEHVRYDPFVSGSYSTAIVVVHNSQSHAKIQGLLHRYLLTGDERALEVVLEALDWAYSFGGTADFKQPRRAGHQVISLVQGYKLTGEQKFIDTARLTFEKWLDFFDDLEPDVDMRFFQLGFLFEGFIDYYEVTGDPRVIPWLEGVVGWMRTHRPGDQFPNMALGLGFLAAETGKPQYLELQKEHLSHWQGTWQNAYKDYAMHGRSVARSLFYLSRLANK